jgi:hypothetical protein
LSLTNATSLWAGQSGIGTSGALRRNEVVTKAEPEAVTRSALDVKVECGVSAEVVIATLAASLGTNISYFSVAKVGELFHASSKPDTGLFFSSLVDEETGDWIIFARGLLQLARSSREHQRKREK